MSPKCLYGKPIAEEILTSLKKDVSALQCDGLTPSLHIILVGNNPASRVYIKKKAQKAEELGIKATLHELPENATFESIQEKICGLNEDPSAHGIILQLPLPNPKVSAQDLINTISPQKDIDGLTALNIGRLVQKAPPFFTPCTAAACLSLIKRTNLSLQGKEALIIGRSHLVGLPTFHLLLQKNCSVSIAHSHTKNLEEKVSHADILVLAAGSPSFVPSKVVKSNALVIDVGISPLQKNGAQVLKGDLDLDLIDLKADFYSPVPGGVGPLTIAHLMKNTVEAAKGFMEKI